MALLRKKGAQAQIADISHNQKTFDAVAYRKAGHTRIRLKATQGTTFTDPTYNERATHARNAGLAIDHYSYLTAENGTAQADYFLAVVRPHLVAGDRVMADCEAAGVTGAIEAEFADRCHTAEPNVDGLIYGGPYFLRDNHIVSTHGWGLVLADYTTGAHPAFWPPGFKGVPVEWQFTDSADVAGIGHCDLSRVVHAKPEPPAPKDLSIFQRRATRAFTRAMKDRKHPFTHTAEQRVDLAVTAATKAKGIR